MSLFISRTPYRISFFGGGSDYPEWYKQNGGSVLSTTIDKYCYLTCRFQPTFFEKKHRIVWSYIEKIDTIAEILHPAVREGLKFLGFNDERGIEIHHQGDLPARTGIGSSSSFSVGLINALTALKGGIISKQDLSEKAIYLERDILKETGGVQDQYAAAYGGFNRIVFNKEGVKILPVMVSENILNKLCSNLILVYSGSSRFSSDVSKSLVNNLSKKEKYLTYMVDQVEKGEKLIKEGKLDEFGNLLDEAWNLKKQLSESITSPEVEELYEQGIKAGALGGKLIGGGSAGFVLFYVPCSKQISFKKALNKFIKIPFKFDYEGSKIIYKDTDNISYVNRVQNQDNNILEFDFQGNISKLSN